MGWGEIECFVYVDVGFCARVCVRVEGEGEGEAEAEAEAAGGGDCDCDCDWGGWALSDSVMASAAARSAARWGVGAVVE